MAPVDPRAPRMPPGPGTPAAAPPGPPYPPDEPWVARDPRLWWQREAAIVAIGLLMLGIGGVLGYVIGHANAKTRVVVATRPGISTVVTHTATVTTPGQTVTTPGHTSPVAHVRTVTTPGKTVTTPGKTVSVKQPPRIVHSTTTKTVTQTTTVTTTASSSSSSTAGGPPQAFNGSGNQSLGTITVPIASQLKWQCPGCANATFTVSNSSTDPSQLGVQAQNTTSGQTSVAAGKYTNVTVQATGSWSITITPGSG